MSDAQHDEHEPLIKTPAGGAAAPAAAPATEAAAPAASAAAPAPAAAAPAAPAAAAAPQASTGDVGKKVYDSTCQMCHAAGVAGDVKAAVDYMAAAAK